MNNEHMQSKHSSEEGRPQKSQLLVWAAVLVLLALATAYFGVQYQQRATQDLEQTTEDTTEEINLSEMYTSEGYGFTMGYPNDFEIKTRREEVRDYEYLGLDVDFFASVRDHGRSEEEKPASVAFLYAVDGVTVEDFTQAVNASDGAEGVKDTETLDITGVEVTKVVNETAIGIDKTHYLFKNNGSLIIVSVFLGEEKAFDPILQSLRLL